MKNLKSSNLFVLYRILSVVLDLRIFSKREIESLAGVANAEVEKFVSRNAAKGFLHVDDSGRFTLTDRGLSVLVRDALDTARELLRIAVRQHLKYPGMVKSMRRREPINITPGSKFRDAMFIAARMEALMRGALPKLVIGKAKPSRIALEEFRQGILDLEDLKIHKPDMEEEELFFEFGDEDELPGGRGYPLPPNLELN